MTDPIDLEEERKQRRAEAEEERKRRELYAKRQELLLSEWLKRELPDPDYLLGSVISTTSRWMIYGDTGLGKTLFAMAMAGAIASGQPFLNWGARQPRRVLYLDGEMPAQVFQARLRLVARSFGDDLQLWGFNRDFLQIGDMPPLDTSEGQDWLWYQMNALAPEVIFFDSIMCLTSGALKEEDSWKVVRPLTHRLSRWKIAQVWLHHTGHDAAHSYGDKSREWDLDTTVHLSRVDEHDERDTAVNLKFQKSRLRTPENAAEFAACTLRFVDGEWQREGAQRSAKAATAEEVMRNAILEAYEHLCDGIVPSRGFNGQPVRKIKAEALRDQVKTRGFLDIDEKGRIRGASREAYRRAKGKLLGSRPPKLVEDGGLIWRP